MIEVLTQYNIDEILEDPMNYVDETEDIALIRVNNTMIMLGMDDDERLYFVLEDDEISEDRYIDSEYPGMTASEAYDSIIDELIKEVK